MQSSFFPRQPPGAPGRPTMHRAHPSMAQLAAAGLLTPSGMPMTPLGQVGFPPPMLPPPFVPRSKRTQSVSTGGPPKAVLGGPQRKVTPLPPIAAAVTPVVPKTKKVIVNLPKETIKEGEDSGKRQEWARSPVPIPEIPEQRDSAWDAMKQKMIEEKLQRLGVEKGSMPTVPHIHAPHARAASISSPADPALLYFKLNKLQQSQNASAGGSLSTSPHPPLNLSPSPNNIPPRFQNRHGHSMSLAPTSSVYNPTAAFNPFGPAATLGSDQIFKRSSPGVPSVSVTVDTTTIHAPQGRVPTSVSSLAPPAPLSRPESRPDFLRGFGLDITEEEEEPVDDADADHSVPSEMTQDDRVDIELEDETDIDGVTTVAQSRIHSRHVSKVSAPLSLRSVGGADESSALGAAMHEMVPSREAVGDVEVDDVDGDAVAEWTGSEDLRTGAETSDDESIGEWSNPSDEERARHERLNRRMLRRAKQIRRDLEAPRRLPNFPQPPGTSFVHLDDDVISNPSEEGDRHLRDQYHAYERMSQYSRPSSNQSTRGRPLPPLPHSRTSSAHFSYHDPALAHSREASDQFILGGAHTRPAPSSSFTPSLPRNESLNPLAKPFVFGTFLASKASAPSPTSANPTHLRGPSASKPLNVAAPEFKPGGFTFLPPPGVPQLTFAATLPASTRPLPTPPVSAVDAARATQGREKRQRRGSSASATNDETDEGNDTMISFKFPPSADESRLLRHSAPASPPATGAGLNVAAKPFTFSGFSGSLQFTSSDTKLNEAVSPNSVANEGDASIAETTIQAEINELESAQELPFPPTAKPKRAPIPLDFKHPVSTNTVPAGLFKALVSVDADERTRRSVRSRLSSRDIFEFEHSPRPSLDDLTVPTISQRKLRNRLFTDPGFRDSLEEPDDVFSPPRRSSLPPRRVLHDEGSSVSELSVGPVNLSRRMEMQQYEQRLEVLLDEKIEEIRKSIDGLKSVSGGQALSVSSESMISEVVSLFRAQLQNSAARALPHDQADAQGDFDFEVLKDILEQTQAESRAVLQRDLEDFVVSRDNGGKFKKFVEDLCERTVKAVMAATSQVSMHLHTVEKSRGSFAAEREAIAHDILSLMGPTLAAMRPEPIDYEGLTSRLTQAVKPHISQLIDLASDKRETAGLIVDRLVPILPTLYPPAPHIDMDGVVGRLTAEIRQIIGPLDAHELKEQVSDLVVERLDSRLAVRDKAFNVETVTGKVTESVLEPLKDLKAAVEAISQTRNTDDTTPNLDFSFVREDIAAHLSGLPDRLSAAVDAFGEARSDFKAHQDRLDKENLANKDVQQLQETLDSVADEQKRLVSQNNEFSDFCQDIIKHINALPEALVEATKVLQNAHADILSHDASQKNSEEVRRLMSSNSELQIQLAKARGAHGQVRVEKDLLADRLRAVEAERDQLRSKLDDVQASVADRMAGAAAAEARNAELEEAMVNALERVKSSDITSKSSHERVLTLEKTVGELNSEKQQLKSKVDKMEMTALFVNREKDSLTEEVALLRRRNEELSSEQSQWDELRRTSEQIQNLAAIIGQADQEETKELKRTRDKFKVLEGEHASLQRRLRDQENKLVNNERAAQTALQTLTQAQQRAVEWEKRARDYEHELESTRTRLEDAERAQSQLDADYSLVKLQLDERDAEERLARDRESKIRDQIASLEGQLARAQAQADRAPPISVRTSAPISSRSRQNGYTHSPHDIVRPDSRVSTVFVDSRVPTPVGQSNGNHHAPSIRATSPPMPSVWNSIHAPSARRDGPIRLPMTPKAARQDLLRRQIPSPTPSNVSAAPTLGDDGWWS
ncbi:hypothetical protein EW026_g4730 [Hermanssonia centrifuga]|uniref:Uncharacterized protein n=1 Tax=Hermanssonia centrifuga TaxID=98765 RepID=A0A4S4KHZ8_9APHY|nr:hypothetical protein EW026_g4730 [Hermanssonia centrifuga]